MHQSWHSDLCTLPGGKVLWPEKCEIKTCTSDKSLHEMHATRCMAEQSSSQSCSTTNNLWVIQSLGILA